MPAIPTLKVHARLNVQNIMFGKHLIEMIDTCVYHKYHSDRVPIETCDNLRRDIVSERTELRVSAVSLEHNVRLTVQNDRIALLF